MPKVDLTLPRECHIQSFRGQPGPCPNCGARLQQEYASFMVATRRGKRIPESFVMGGQFGWFCAACPTVVIDSREAEAMLYPGLSRWKVGNEWAVLGMVNLEAVPPDKRHLPLGTDENPYPLVELTYPDKPQTPAKSERSQVVRSVPEGDQPKKRRRRRR